MDFILNSLEIDTEGNTLTIKKMSKYNLACEILWSIDWDKTVITHLESISICNVVNNFGAIDTGVWNFKEDTIASRIISDAIAFLKAKKCDIPKILLE